MASSPSPRVRALLRDRNRRRFHVSLGAAAGLFRPRDGVECARLGAAA
jgi:hypothetical protein